MSLVERIKDQCKEKKTTIKAMEREIGFGNGTISRWDTNAPSYDKVIKVADFLQVSFNWLIFGKEAAELSPAEQKLLDAYRESNSTGQELIFDYTQTIKKKFPAELESSNSKLG